MALQSRELAMAGLSVLKDVPPHALQPKLPDGIHLRWAFERSRGFPWHGYYLFRRRNLGGDRKITDVELDKLGQPGAAGTAIVLAGGELSADATIMVTDDFAPPGVGEADLSGQSELRFVPDEIACELVVEIGFRQDAEVELTALLQQVPVASVRVRGQAGSVERAVVKADAISELRIAGAPAALVALGFIASSADATAGWQPVPKVTYPLELPVAHPDYPLRQATVADARSLATGRVRYGSASFWTASRFGAVHGELEKLVDGGLSGAPMASKTNVVSPSPAVANLTMPAQSPLDMVLLGALNPAVAQIVGLFWVDDSVKQGERWDYLIVADHDGLLGRDPAKALRYLRSSGWGAVDAYIVFDKSLDDPAPPLEPPAWARSYAVPGDQIPSAGLRWERDTATGGQLLPGGALMHHVWRLGHGDTQPATPGPDPGQALTKDAPVLAADPPPGAPAPPAPPAGWPPFRLLFSEGGLAEGWYGYRVSGVDLFGRHSKPGDPASWHAPTAAEAQLHPFAIGLLDKTPPPAPTMVEAQALDPGDPLVIRDETHDDWRAALPPDAAEVKGLRVRWLWTAAQIAQAPDTAEFRIYFQPGRLNARSGRVTTVAPATTAGESVVGTDIANALPAGAWTGTRLVVGNDAFEVLGSEAVTPLRLRVRNLGVQGEIAPPGGPCGLAIPQGHPLFADYGAAPAWAERTFVVPYDERFEELTPGGDRQYDVFLPDPAWSQHPGLPLTTSSADPIAYAHVGVSAADDKKHTGDDAKWSSGAWGGRIGNEGRVGGPATIFLVHRQPPDPPALPPFDGDRLWATKADYHSHSYFTYRWLPQPGLKLHVLRAMDEGVFEADWANRPGWGTLDPAGDAADRALFPAEARWDAAKLQAVAGELNAIRALKAASGTTKEQALAAYRALGSDAVRVLAGLPGAEAAFAQLTIEALDPEDPANGDRRGPDSPAAYTPSAALRAYVDELDGRSSNRWLYRALYVDAAQNRSGLSLATPPVWLPDVVPPRAPRITKVAAGERAITVSWASNREPDLAEYRVYRADEPEQARDVRLMTLVHTEPVAAGDPLARPAAVSFTDDPVPPLRNLTYRVTAVDDSGNVSEPSSPVAGRAYDLTAPDPPVWERVEWVQLDALGGEHPWTATPPSGETWRPAAALTWNAPEPAKALVQRKPPDADSWSSVSGWIDARHDDARDVWVATAYDETADPSAPLAYRLKVQSAAGNLNTAFDEAELAAP
jgi:hypothetical protein